MRTGGRRPNLEVAGEEELPQPLLSTATGREGELARWAAAPEGRKENRGRRVWEPWKGVPGGEFVSADDHITGKKSLVTVGPGQNLCKGWYSVLQNWKWPGALGQVCRWEDLQVMSIFMGLFKLLKGLLRTENCPV